MQKYYYHILTDPDDEADSVIVITGTAFFQKFGYISDQTSAHYDDEPDPLYNSCSYVENEDPFGLHDLKYIDEEFTKLYSFLSDEFGAYESSESVWSSDDFQGFVKFLQNHPDFSENEQFSAFVEESFNS